MSVWICRVVVPVLVVVFSWGSLSGSVDLFGGKFGRVGGRVELVVGRWLGEAFPEETTILFDAYAYIPDRFPNAVSLALGQSYSMVNHLEPELLVARDAIARRTRNREDAERTQIEADAFLNIHYFNKYLEGGQIPAYRLLRDFGTVSVYRWTVPKVPGASWTVRVHLMLSGKLYGQVAARRTMGDVHAAIGVWNEAVREY